MDHDALGLQLHALREKVAGVTDTVIAAADGLLIAADAARVLDLDCISALAAADLGLAQRTTAATSQGSFRHTVVHGSGGCTALYAVGCGALIAVLGDEGLDIGRLHIEAQPVIERIGSILSAR